VRPDRESRRQVRSCRRRSRANLEESLLAARAISAERPSESGLALVVVNVIRDVNELGLVSSSEPEENTV
jgi:hypothetical protein